MSERHELTEHFDAIRAAGLGEHVDAIEALLKREWVDGYYGSGDTCRCGLSGEWEPYEMLSEQDRLARRQFTANERGVLHRASLSDEQIDEHIASHPIPFHSADERRESMRQQRDEARLEIERLGLPV